MVSSYFGANSSLELNLRHPINIHRITYTHTCMYLIDNKQSITKAYLIGHVKHSTCSKISEKQEADVDSN